MAIRPQRLRLFVGCLVGLCGLVLWPGCGGEPPPPPTGSAEFEAAKKEYQEVRRKERGLESFEFDRAVLQVFDQQVGGDGAVRQARCRSAGR